MEREKLESMLIDYIDGNLSEADKKIVEAELDRNEELKTLYNQLQQVMGKMGSASELEPTESLKRGFEHFLNQETKQMPKGKSVSMFPMFYRIAASIVLLLVAGVTGYWVRKDMQNQEKMAAMEKALEDNKRVMMALLDNQLSPSQRMQGVTVAYEMSKPDDEIVNILVKTLNNDPNTNVRLAALDALGKFSSEADVRKALIESLSSQKDPVIQIALIQLMVAMKEKSVIKQLERMTTDTRSIQAVKDEAYSGIFKLS